MTFKKFLIKNGYKRREATIIWQRIILGLPIGKKADELFKQWYKNFY